MIDNPSPLPDPSKPLAPNAGMPSGTEVAGAGAHLPLMEGSGAFAPPPPLPEEDGGFDVRRYVAALFRYKWMIIAITVLGSIAGIGATRFLSPSYQTQGTFWIEGSATDAGPIRTGNLLDTFAWVELLRSFEVLEHVAREHRLWIEAADSLPPALFAGLMLTDSVLTGAYEVTLSPGGTVSLVREDGQFSQTAEAGQQIGQGAGIVWTPPADLLVPGTVVPFSVGTPRGAAVEVNRRLNASTDPNGSFMRVRFIDTNPRRAARVLNAIMDRYITLAADIKRERLSEMTAILDEQLGRARQSLEQAENALESFRVRTITLPSAPAVPVAPGLAATTQPAINDYFAMKTQEDELRQDREALQTILQTAADSGIRTDELELIPAVGTSTELGSALSDLNTARAQLRGLRNLYTEENPQVIRAAEDVRLLERDLIPRQIQVLVETIVGREAVLASRIASAGTELEEIPQRRIQEDRLSRTRGIAEDLYRDLEQRYQQAQLAEASTVPDVRILDRPSIPQLPTKNQTPIVIILGIGMSFALGVGAALLLDRLDGRVRYPDQITKDLGLPILGVIPRVNPGANTAHFDPVIEAFRGVRLSLVHSTGTRGPVVVTITSAGGGDGKSFTASNLALAFAEAGHRTLLIDGDVRRGQLHRLFGVARKPGITDLLQGGASRDETIRGTEYSSLDFIGCGTRTHAAPELLGSPAMADLLAQMRGQYGVIIVDSAPMSAGIDAFALASLTQNLLLVVRTGTTNREMTSAKLDALDRMPIRVLGAVLNDVKPGMDGYYYGYYSYYLPGYTADDESFAPVAEGAES